MYSTKEKLFMFVSSYIFAYLYMVGYVNYLPYLKGECTQPIDVGFFDMEMAVISFIITALTLGGLYILSKLSDNFGDKASYIFNAFILGCYVFMFTGFYIQYTYCGERNIFEMLIDLF